MFTFGNVAPKSAERVVTENLERGSNNDENIFFGKNMYLLFFFFIVYSFFLSCLKINDMIIQLMNHFVLNIEIGRVFFIEFFDLQIKKQHSN